jgi:hypothetical protein
VRIVNVGRLVVGLDRIVVDLGRVVGGFDVGLGSDVSTGFGARVRRRRGRVGSRGVVAVAFDPFASTGAGDGFDRVVASALTIGVVLDRGVVLAFVRGGRARRLVAVATRRVATGRSGRRVDPNPLADGSGRTLDRTS